MFLPNRLRTFWGGKDMGQFKLIHSIIVNENTGNDTSSKTYSYQVPYTSYSEFYTVCSINCHEKLSQTYKCMIHNYGNDNNGTISNDSDYFIILNNSNDYYITNFYFAGNSNGSSNYGVYTYGDHVLLTESNSKIVITSSGGYRDVNRKISLYVYAR